MAEKLYGDQFSFAKWMLFGVPFSVLMIGVVWLVLTKIVFRSMKSDLPIGSNHIKKELDSLGKMTFEEKAIGSVFAAVAFLWISRSFLLGSNFNDTTIAIDIRHRSRLNRVDSNAVDSVDLVAGFQSPFRPKSTRMN